MRGTGLVVDAGGTYLRAGRYQAGKGLETGGVLRIASPSFLTHPKAVLQESLVQEICGLPQAKGARWAAVSICGPVSEAGVVHRAPPRWGDLDRPYGLRRAIERRLRIPVLVVNDLTAAAAAYGEKPAYRSLSRILVVTVSSGLGNKVYDVRRKEALLDAQGRAGEIGHWRADDSAEGLPCDCGGRGHLSSVASGRGAERLAKRMARESSKFKRSPLSRATISPETLAIACRERDPFALSVLEASVAPLARAVSLVVTSVGIDKVILVGGFALGVGETYRRAFLASFKEAGVFGRKGAELSAMVDLGEPDDAIGLTGAGILAANI